VIKDMVDSLRKHGFRRFFFINGHGGNIATVTTAFSEIYAEQSLGPSGNKAGVKCRLQNWWATPGVSKLSKELYGDAEGSHATPSEVSLTWFAYPEAARPMQLDPPIAPRGGFTDADDYRRNFPDGRIGSNPGLASVAAGKRYFDTAVTEIAEEYAKWASAG
jgi:creatinine amidohydrolase